MNNEKNEFIIGLVVSFAAIVLITSIIILGKSEGFSSATQLNAITDNAQKLEIGSEVLYKGVRVGRLSEIRIERNNVIMKLKISK